MSQRPCLDAIDERVRVCDGAMGPLGIRIEPWGAAVARELVAAVRPLVSGAQIGTAGRQFSSRLGVLEAAG